MLKRVKVVGIFMVGIFFLSACIQYQLEPGEISVAQNNSFEVEVHLDNCIEVPFFEVKIYCKDVSDIYGVGFDLNYDSNVIRFQGISLTGSVLSGATAVTGFRNSGTDNGKLVVGISKQGQVSGEPGAGKIATITFQAVSEGTTELNFADPHLVDSTGKFLVGWPWYWASLGKASVSVSP